ncbi:MAG: fructose-bisphosphatase class III, partial [Proteobacteria bacterium]|nr:fructose-bisphosphatase class III [Pseudomonadota bacterium]
MTSTASHLLDYPGLPSAWMGDNVHVANYDGPVAVIGDIHGSSALLKRLLTQLGNMPIIVTGDVGDRGPNTRGVVDLLRQRGAIGVAGNHDLWLMGWAAGEGLDALALSNAMGGRSTLASYGVTPEEARDNAEAVPALHRQWLLELHVVIDLGVGTERYWIVHGGIPSDLCFEGLLLEQVVPFLAENRTADLMWRRNPPEAMVPVGRPIIMGHQPRAEPVDLGHVICVDTGAGHNGRLTAVVLPQRRFVSVE